MYLLLSVYGINPTASDIQRVVLKAEAVLDTFIEAEEFTGRLRRRDDAGGGTHPMLETILDRVLGSVEGVVEIPFEDEGTD